MIHKLEFTVISKMLIEYNDIENSQRHNGLKWFLELSDNLAQEVYFDNDLPNKDGVKVITRVLVNALIANIHYAHDNKVKDSAEHLREAIKEMEKLFVEIATTKKDTF